MDGKRQRNRPTFCPEGCSMGIRHTYYCALQPLLQNLFIVKTTANKTIASHRIERERERKKGVLPRTLNGYAAAVHDDKLQCATITTENESPMAH